jgi:hypothetical protein
VWKTDGDKQQGSHTKVQEKRTHNQELPVRIRCTKLQVEYDMLVELVERHCQDPHASQL